MNPDTDTEMTTDPAELSDFELQVQWSEFVPSPVRFLLLPGHVGTPVHVD